MNSSKKQVFSRPVRSDTRPLDNATRLAEYRAKWEMHEEKQTPRLRQAAKNLSEEPG